MEKGACCICDCPMLLSSSHCYHIKENHTPPSAPLSSPLLSNAPTPPSPSPPHSLDNSGGVIARVVGDELAGQGNVMIRFMAMTAVGFMHGSK